MQDRTVIRLDAYLFFSQLSYQSRSWKGKFYDDDTTTYQLEELAGLKAENKKHPKNNNRKMSDNRKKDELNRTSKFKTTVRYFFIIKKHFTSK